MPAAQTVQGPTRLEFNPQNANSNIRHFKASRGIKRKAAESSDGNADSTGSEFMQPLYCKVCRVMLNAPAQAKQHYEGKNHSRKLKIFMEGKPEKEDGKEQVSCHGNDLDADIVLQGWADCQLSRNQVLYHCVLIRVISKAPQLLDHSTLPHSVDYFCFHHISLSTELARKPRGAVTVRQILM